MCFRESLDLAFQGTDHCCDVVSSHDTWLLHYPFDVIFTVHIYLNSLTETDSSPRENHIMTSKLMKQWAQSLNKSNPTVIGPFTSIESTVTIIR